MYVRWRVLLLSVCLGGCGGSAGPAPTAPDPTAPLVLLAGESNAYFLEETLPRKVSVVSFPASIDYWLSATEFADATKRGPFAAFVWWQGNGDAGVSVDEYGRKLRALFQLVRAADPAMPIRIIEIADLPDRANVRQAQREVAADPRVAMIPTADLTLADAAGHFIPPAYPIVRDRIYRSIGR